MEFKNSNLYRVNDYMVAFGKDITLECGLVTLKKFFRKDGKYINGNSDCRKDNLICYKEEYFESTYIVKSIEDLGGYYPYWIYLVEFDVKNYINYLYGERAKLNFFKRMLHSFDGCDHTKEIFNVLRIDKKQREKELLDV